MANKPNLDTLLVKNPRVDGDTVRKAVEVLKELRRLGLSEPPGYRLLPPFGPRRLMPSRIKVVPPRKLRRHAPPSPPVAPPNQAPQ